jgi:hypothetical protein
MTTRKLTAMGKRFMRLLEMDEWIARAEFKVTRLKGLCGESAWHPEERKCWIAISPAPDEEMAETLVHELLHVLYEGHLPPVGMDGDAYDASYELGLNRTARALYKEWSKSDR